MFGAYFLFTSFGMNPYLALLHIAVLGLLLGMIMYVLAVHRVINAPHLSTLLATFAVNMIIIGLGTAALTTTPRNIDFSLGSFVVGPATILWNRLAAALATIVIVGLLYLFLQRTRPGKHIRAVTDNRSAPQLMGVPSSRVLALTFGLGSMLAAVAGALLGGLILGAIEGLLPGFVPTTWVPVFEFVFFVLILLWRPNGLLGARR